MFAPEKGWNSPWVTSAAVVLLGALTAAVLVAELRQGEMAQAVLAGLVLALIVAVGVVRGVRGHNRLRWHAVLDAFAEGELARQRQQIQRLPASRRRGDTLSLGR